MMYKFLLGTNGTNLNAFLSEISKQQALKTED